MEGKSHAHTHFADWIEEELAEEDTPPIGRSTPIEVTSPEPYQETNLKNLSPDEKRLLKIREQMSQGYDFKSERNLQIEILKDWVFNALSVITYQATETALENPRVQKVLHDDPHQVLFEKDSQSQKTYGELVREIHPEVLKFIDYIKEVIKNIFSQDSHTRFFKLGIVFEKVKNIKGLPDITIAHQEIENTLRILWEENGDTKKAA